MDNYNIWMLEASNISVSGGKSLDGITQGNGSHLPGETIRFDSNDFLEVRIRDNDGDQVLRGAQTIDGVRYSNNTVVVAEYRLTLRDPATGETWDVQGFNAINSSPSHPTIEGLAFVGPPGGFPPTGVDLEVIAAFEGPGSLDVGDPDSPLCFTPGTRILTSKGYVPVEDLCPGDKVRTRDAGCQPVCWTGSVELNGDDLVRNPRFRPVLIRADAFGTGRPARDLLVSPQHRILLRHWLAEIHFAESEVLVPALHLVNGRSITQVARPQGVTYIHIMCDAHQVIWAEGLATETFLPGNAALDGMPKAVVAELFALFPELARPGAFAAQPARPILRGWEGRILSEHMAIGQRAI